MHSKGFTVLEILIVIAIIGILGSIVLINSGSPKRKAYYSRALLEFRNIETALELYRFEYNKYPNDIEREIPPGLEQYLAGHVWPKAPWPGSVYDWDNWVNPANHAERIYQISIRFCPIGGNIRSCKFPDETWSKNFKVNSSVYFCIKGPCRAHINEPIDYPGYCVNCANH